jgi:hypothetical protein
MLSKISFSSAAVLACFAVQATFAQTTLSGQKNVVSTSVPFLIVPPEARAAGMGDVGAATSPDANSVHWNPSKLAFIEKDFGFATSYSPWLRNIVPDMSLSYVSGYYRLRKQDVIAASIRYFDLGKINFTDAQGQRLQDFNPREFAFDLSYSRLLSRNLSMAVTARYFSSNLAGNVSNGTANASPANSASVDISVFYTKDKLSLLGVNSRWSLGANISNIGPKVAYVDKSTQNFIPANLRLGTAWTGEFDEYNKLTIAIDANKLLVPTPPIVDVNTGNIIKGKDNRDVSLFAGIFGSFTDAPDGAAEEFREIQWSLGAEYWYNRLIAVRAGYFYEDDTKGSRKYFTLGAGLRYQMFGIDFAYMLPQGQTNPLADTMRFTLHFDFNKSKKGGKEDSDVQTEPTQPQG